MRGDKIDAGLTLLDRKIVDRESHVVGTVDDLELHEDASTSSLYVSALLCGPTALSRRVGGRLGALMRVVHQALYRFDASDPVRIPLDVVADVDSEVRLSVLRSELDGELVGGKIASAMLSRIPGAGHDPE